MKVLLQVSAVTLLTSVGVNAAAIVEYDYTAVAGKDPATQGFTLNNNSDANAFADGYDEGTGWRTVDGTTAAPANYSQDITSSVGALTSASSWVLSWSLALDSDAVTAGGSAVANYYSGANNSRQNNIVVLVDVDNTYRYSVNHTVVGDVVHLDVNGGTAYSTGVGLDAFGTYSLTYDKALDQVTLDYSAGTIVIAGNSTDPNRNAVFFGAGTSAGQGSAIWSEVTLNAVPEASAAALFGLGGLAFALRRRR